MKPDDQAKLTPAGLTLREAFDQFINHWQSTASASPTERAWMAFQLGYDFARQEEAAAAMALTEEELDELETERVGEDEE